MKKLAFRQVDVFTAVPFTGTPVAVVLDGDAVSSDRMQSIAAWTNLSDDVRLRANRPAGRLSPAYISRAGSSQA
jgi:PhzF family phenazine biosynthesis protein